MTQNYTYHIGSPGVPWTQADKALWLHQQIIKRSYHNEVVVHIEAMQGPFNVEQYGVLEYADGPYPLYAITNKQLDNDKPTVLITGGVHGYETSGVQGALRFAMRHASEYEAEFNLIIAPCISPWGYETINRWNPMAIDPNRSFVPQSESPEAAQIMAFVSKLGLPVHAHIDLHETTDTDNSEFRPALCARDGKAQDIWQIPDGFYTVGDTQNPQDAFQRAVVSSVEKVTHIALPDEEGKLIGSPMIQHGVIHYALKDLGLCAGFTNAEYTTTTEVYPDSANATPEECILAQVAAVTGALDYLREQQ
ncbi:hypothetical protein FX988_00778 [Paraglaciecola mesophila]|uniref:Peptidase M14 domain-containing protein n=1 Tax=Paraglaciecola mesophila TaxID=197222 RepID=A0A857JIU7_9ALTE|nr:M14 family metallocarboxypeptidase [Paraglaciecola mesophila]QHJ10564.1 hypothetical protein FX988_00778 [Paraglaciecola mesophila]